MAVELLVTGGAFDDRGEGFVWHVDLKTERATRWAAWDPPQHLHVAAKGFAGGSLHQGALYVAAHAAVVRFDLETARVTGVLNQPDFNDLHHVAHDGEHLWVVNTGGDALEVFDSRGQHLARHSWLPAWVMARRLGGDEPHDLDHARLTGWDGSAPGWRERSELDPYYDTNCALPYHQRKLADRLHPNHVTHTPDGPVVTCLLDGSFRRPGGQPLCHVEGHCHDGIIDDDTFWCTTTEGVVYAAPWPPTPDRPARRHLEVSSAGHMGWCRGLALTSDLLLVGLTEVRDHNARWSFAPADRTETSVLAFDRQSGQLLARVPLELEGRHLKIYSLLVLP